MERVAILILPRERILPGAKLRAVSHVLGLIRIPEAILDDTVLGAGVAEPGSRPKRSEKVRRTGHALHPSRNNGAALAKFDFVCREHHRL